MAYPKISLIPDFKQENGAVLDFPHVFTETHATRSNILRRELGRQRGAKLVPRKKSSPNLETSRLSRSLFPSFRSASITLHLPDSPSPNASFHLLCRRLLQIATIQANQSQDCHLGCKLEGCLDLKLNWQSGVGGALDAISFVRY